MRTTIYKDGNKKEVWTVDLTAWLEDGWLTNPIPPTEAKKTTTRKTPDSD